MAFPIPEFYRAWFLVVDPARFLTTVLNNLYKINMSAVEPETKIILDSMVGLVAALYYLLFDLLRERHDDLLVWRRVQASMLLIDIAAMCAFVGVLGVHEAQTLLRVKMCAVGVAAIVRIAFLMNIGLGMKDEEREFERRMCFFHRYASRSD